MKNRDGALKSPEGTQLETHMEPLRDTMRLSQKTPRILKSPCSSQNWKAFGFPPCMVGES